MHTKRSLNSVHNTNYIIFNCVSQSLSLSFICYLYLYLRMWEQLKRRSSYQALPTIDSKKPIDIFRDLHHPIFQNIRIVHVLIV